jgi:hypothetical protein
VKDGYLDGIAIMTDAAGKPQGLLYSDWVAFKPEGQLYWIGGEGDDNGGGQGTQVALDIPHGPPGGPADFFFEPKSSVLALPCMLEGRVLLLGLEPKK